MFFRWMQPLWEGEGAGSGGGEAGKPAGEGGKPTGGGAGGGESSLRAQLASQLGEEERGGFSKWAETYPTDKDFAVATMTMRQQFDARVPVPGEGAKPEEVSKYFERVGKPTEAKAYAYDFGKDDKGKPIELPDTDRARFEAYKEFAFSQNMTQAQFAENIKWYEDANQNDNQAMVEMLDRAQDDSAKLMKQEWGPDYEANLAAATDGGLAFAPDAQSWEEFVNLPLVGPDGKQIKVGDHPTFLRTFAKLGRATAEDTRVRNLNTSGEAASVQDAINKIEQEAIAAHKSTASEPYVSRLRPLYQKLHNNTPMGGVNRGRFGA